MDGREMGYRDELVRRLNAAWAARGQAGVDVLFVLDCTATMVGEIEALRDAIPSLADALGHGGGKGRSGLIELRDGLQGEGAVVHAFGGRRVTEDPIVFQREVAALRARGPSPRPDGALDALLLACPPPFTIDARRVIVFVTDGRPPASQPERRAREGLDEAPPVPVVWGRGQALKLHMTPEGLARCDFSEVLFDVS